MFTWFKKEIEQEELAALNEASSLFSTMAAKLETILTNVQTKYAAEVEEIEAPDAQKQNLNTVDAKINNVLIKLKELL